MKSSIYKTLMNEYRAGVLFMPEQTIPIIHMLEGECNSVEESKLRDALLVIDELLQQYDAKHPNAWSEVFICHDGDIFELYMGFGEDRKTVAFLDAIKQQIENILALLEIKSYICISLKK